MPAKPLDDLKEITSFTGDVNLVNGSQTSAKRPARYVRIVGAGSGNMKVDIAGTGGVSTQTFTGLVANEEIEAFITKIYETGTDVTKVRVGW